MGPVNNGERCPIANLFRTQKLPFGNAISETLANFELLELYEAMLWLKNSPSVNGGKVVIAGTSRGAELAVLFASLLNQDKNLVQPDAIVTHCPSDQTYGSWNLDWEDDRCWLEKIPQSPPRGHHPSEKSVWNTKCGQDPRYLSENLKSAWKWKGAEIKTDTRIREGPIEGVQSTGASFFQTIWFAIVPQVILPYISFTVYRWDTNVRMATIIGFVGGGGIGTMLIKYQGQAMWNEVGTIVIVIAVVVWAMDQASALIRDALK